MNNTMIPKKIHYCWFGEKKKPKVIERCINSWKEVLDDYEIIEWNESNFDVNSNKFIREAYSLKKYAFVSDFVRVYALYNFGGIYLDTDVEVFKSFDDFLKEESFWGFEEKNRIATSTIGCKKGNELIKEFLDSYENKSFISEDGEIDITPNVCKITELMVKHGAVLNGKYQKIDGLATIYEQEYFSPYDYINCYMKKTRNTYAVHHFYKSWVSLRARIKSNIKIIVAKVIGGDKVARMREYLNKS